MVIFSWICLGLIAFLLLCAGLCWLTSLLLDDRDWRRLGLKIYRWAKVALLFYVNAAIYAHIVLTFF
jgi:hypothetical protein